LIARRGKLKKPRYTMVGNGYQTKRNIGLNSHKSSDGLFLVFVALIFGFTMIYGLFGGLLVSESKAVNAAKDAGYSNIQVVDRSTVFVALRGCSKSDTVRFTVKGTNANGEREFYVCASWTKGGTVRSK
jgi:hypothetical protein